MQPFTNIRNLGKLFCDLMLIETDVPDLLIVKDGRRRRYIAMVLNDNQDYLLSPVNSQVLRDFLLSKISMRNAILSCPKSFILKLNPYPEAGTFTVINAQDLKDEQLPDKGAKLNFTTEEITAYTTKLYNEIYSTKPIRNRRGPRVFYQEHPRFKGVACHTTLTRRSRTNKAKLKPSNKA